MALPDGISQAASGRAVGSARLAGPFRGGSAQQRVVRRRGRRSAATQYAGGVSLRRECGTARWPARRRGLDADDYRHVLGGGEAGDNGPRAIRREDTGPSGSSLRFRGAVRVSVTLEFLVRTESASSPQNGQSS